MNIAKTVKGHVYLYVMVIAIFASTGCSTVTTELNPAFDCRSYQWFNRRGSSIVDIFFDRFLQDELRMEKYPNDEINKVMDICVFMEKGFCFFPSWYGHFELTFHTPKVIIVKITDAKSKDVLLTIHYQRGIFCLHEDLWEIDRALRDAFKEAHKSHRPKEGQSDNPLPVTTEKQ